ncbi:MAG: type II toxin-antitoxin system HicB family antitoxin [Microthrixaceae bacterium]
MNEVPSELTVAVHMEGGSYWAEVVELPGCFAAGDTFGELQESLQEAIELYLDIKVGRLELEPFSGQENQTAVLCPA